MRHDDGTDVVAGEIVVGCTFEPTHADIDDLAACLAAAHDHTCFWPPLGLLTIREDRHDPWRKIARAAFDHRGYLPSIEAARREGLTIYDICRDERRPATQADIDGIERRVTILDRGRAEVFAEVERCHVEIAELKTVVETLSERSGWLLQSLNNALASVISRDARIAELKSRLASEQTESDKDADKAANAGPVGGVWPAGAAKPLPDSASESPRAHNQFRDFGGDRRRIGG